MKLTPQELKKVQSKLAKLMALSASPMKPPTMFRILPGRLKSLKVYPRGLAKKVDRNVLNPAFDIDSVCILRYISVTLNTYGGLNYGKNKSRNWQPFWKPSCYQ